MAKAWQNTRSRQLAMQGTMWLVFGAAVAIASLTDREIRSSQTVNLGSPIAEGPVTFRLPEHWAATTADEFGTRLLTKAVDPSDEAGRDVTVILQRVDHLMAPLTYLQRADELPSNAGDLVLTPVALKGVPGQVVRWAVPAANDETRSVACCCLMLPTGQALTIRLERNDDFDDSDQRLFQAILSSVTISGSPVLRRGTIHLRNGILIGPAADFAIYPATDPLRSDNELVRQTTGGGWVSARCVPMVMGNLPAGSLRGALLALDPVDTRDTAAANWISSDAIQIDANHWRIDPHDPADGWVHRRAYVLTAPSGPAMLLLLTANYPASDADLDQAYADLHVTIPAKTGAIADTLLADGAAALADVGSERGGSGEQWWLWQRQGNTEGTTRSYLDPTGQLPVRETLRRDWHGSVWRVTQRWGLGESTAGAWAQSVRYDDVMDQATFVSDMRVSDQIVTTLQFNGQEFQNKIPNSPAMVSGARLPALLAGMKKPAVAIWTDHYPGFEDEPYPTPLLLVVRRVSSGDSGSVVEAEVNGTGQTSRWFFAPDGTFQHADFCGGVSVQPATLSEVISATQSDPRLTPARQQPTMDSGSPQ